MRLQTWLFQIFVQLIGVQNVAALRDWMAPAQFYWLVLSIGSIIAGVVMIFHTVVPSAPAPEEERKISMGKLSGAVACFFFGWLLFQIINFEPHAAG